LDYWAALAIIGMFLIDLLIRMFTLLFAKPAPARK
jgi:hypothetical protein